ncbi:MAG: Crp/Fnr family transcriptional regulator [Cocleimonas sp.]|nr:Crp/Fnr family transcriptional regulator [Cocleimonas sp.]
MIKKLFVEYPVLKPQRLSLKKGDRLFNQGDNVTQIYFIQTGKIKLIRNSSDGSLIVLHIGQQGESIAEASLFSNQYHCSAIVDSASEIFLINKQALILFLEENPKLMIELLTIFSCQIRGLRTLNEIKNIRSAKERVLIFIKMNVNENKEFKPDLPLKDIAHKIGLAHETFYRTLKSLENSGHIHRNIDRIKLL